MIFPEKSKQRLLLLIFFCGIFFFFGFFGKAETAQAGNCVCCTFQLDANGLFTTNPATCDPGSQKPPFEAKTAVECGKYCKSTYGRGEFFFEEQATYIDQHGNPHNAESNDICGYSDWLGLNFIKCLLLAILRFLGYLLSAATSLFEYIVNPEIFMFFVDNEATYRIWKMIRDILNISFILVLLFYAFCTVFQIKNFNYKNRLLHLVLMALLVNFSFPIARFIIDFSNVTMYYILGELFGSPGGANGTGIFSQIAGQEGGKLGKLLKLTVSSDLSYIMAAVVFVFIFTITLLAIALLLLVRTVALMLGVVFSSVGFVGSVVPGLEGKSKEFWSAFIQYSLFGPIIIFMLYVSVEILKEVGKTQPALYKIAGSQSPDPDFIFTLVYFMFPIFILWAGIIYARKSSIAGASAIVGGAVKAMKWGGMTLTGAGFATGTWKAYQKRRSENEKDWWRNRLGTATGSQVDRFWPTKSANLRYQRDLAQKIDNESKRNDMENKNPDELRALAASGNSFVAAAAAKELVNQKALSPLGDDRELYERVRTKFGAESQAFKQINNKLKSYAPVAAFSHLPDDKRAEATKAYYNSNKFNHKDLVAENFAGEEGREFLQIGIDNGAYSQGDLMDMKKKGGSLKKNVEDRLGELARSGNYSSVTDEKAKNVQKAYATFSGEIANPSFAAHIFETGDKDNLKDLKVETLRDPFNISLFTEKVNPGKINSIISNMKDKEAQKYILEEIRSGRHGGSNASALKEAVERNPYSGAS